MKMKMKKILEVLFKKETELNYVLPKYQPAPLNYVTRQLGNTDYYVEKPSREDEVDEMQIDRIYRCS